MPHARRAKLSPADERERIGEVTAVERHPGHADSVSSDADVSDIVRLRPGRWPRGVILRLLVRLSEVGARPESSEDEKLRQGMLIFASVLIALLSFIWVVTYAVHGYTLAAAIVR